MNRFRLAAPGLWERGSKWCKRHQQAAISAGAFLLLLISVLGIAAVWINHERQKAVANMELAQQAAARQGQLRAAAEQSELRAQQLLYFADMKLASQAWRERNLRQYTKLLDRHRPLNGQRDLRGFAWHYLWTCGHVAHQELSRHQDQVWCVRVSPDGQWIASAGADGVIRVRNACGDHQHAIRMPAQVSVSSIAFSPDSRRLVSASLDGYLWLWDVESGDDHWAIPAHEPDAYESRVVFAADGELIASSGEEPEIRTRDAQSGEPRGTIRGHQDTIFGLASSPDEPLLASASRDKTVRLWNLRTQSEERLLENHQNRLTSVAFSPDGSMLASGATDRTVNLWEVSSGKKLGRLKLLDEVGSLDFSADGRWLAVGDRNHSIHLYRIDGNGKIEEPEHISPQWEAHDGRVNTVCFLPDGQLLSGGSDGCVKRWNPFSNRLRRLTTVSGELRISDAAFTADGRQLLLGGKGGIYIWNVVEETLIARLNADLHGQPSLAVAPGGKTAAVTDAGAK